MFEGRGGLSRIVALLLLMAGLALGLSGCGSAPPTHYPFTFPVSDAQSVWPSPPDQPRFEYIGDLIGEDGFSPAKSQGLSRFVELLAGVGFEVTPTVGLQRPQAGVVDELGRIYISDVSSASIFVFDEPLGQLSVWRELTPRVRLQQPIGIAVGRQGHLLIADAELRRVFEVDKEGLLIATYGEGLLGRPTGIASDLELGRFYVADTREDNIKVFSTEGVLLDVWSSSGTADGELNAPVYLSVYQHQLYVTDTLNARIQVLNQQGEFVTSYGHRGLQVGNLVRPKGVALDSDGNLYIVESYYDHLLIFNQQGQFLLPIGGAGHSAGKFFLPAGVWIDGKDRVFVADMLNGRVSVFQYISQAKLSGLSHE